MDDFSLEFSEIGDHNMNRIMMTQIHMIYLHTIYAM